MQWLVWLSLFLVGCGGGLPQHQIQRHLEKHDPWVEDHFHATIDFWSREQFEKAYEKSCFSPAGYYSHLTDQIILHNPSGERWEQTLGILDHELVHMLFDVEEGRKVSFGVGGAKGPTYGEMEKYMSARVKQPEFDLIRTDIESKYKSRCQRRWRSYLHREEEVMGRMIDSLYSLYFGPYDYKYFPLTMEDLFFLTQYTYNGEPLFRKGIERYRIGMKMHEIGIAPSIIQHKLEFATEFKYKGQQYHWPKLERDFRSQIQH